MQYDLTLAPATDPTSIYRYRDGLYAADLLACAIVHLDLFSWLAVQPASPAEICRHFEIAERPTDVMLTLFCAMELLRRDGGAFSVTAKAREHLVKSSPWFLGPYYASLKDRPVCQDFFRVLKTDRPANWGSFRDEKDWARAMEQPAFAESFTAAMDCRGVFLGQAVAQALDLSRYRKLLDIAGGSGIYACSIAAHHSHLEATVFEKKPVDKVATAAIAKRGFSSRVKVVEGDMFAQDLPTGYDIHLISNVLHDWNMETVERLLGKSASSLATPGLLVIHDVHINDEKTGPLPNASYSAMLMHATEGKCYSTSELFPVLKALGFKEIKHTETAADRSIVIAFR